MDKSRVPLALGLAFWSLLAQAQTLPVPKEFYFDADAQTTREMVALRGEGDALIDRLAASVARKPDDVEARAQLARVAMRSGRGELANELYQAAQRIAAGNQRLARQVGWNYGWDLYQAGEYQRALDQWNRLLGGWPATPSWQPPTFALVLWKLDRRNEALSWYAAAVRTEPNLWTSSANFPRLLPDWREEDRQALAEVQLAWQAAPPSWP